MAVFITPDCDFAAIWTSLSTYLQQFGLRCIEHTQGFKYRVCPQSPLAFNEWKEFLHEATLALPGQGRPAICKKASCLKKANGLPSAPTGANCIDIEIYKVHQGKPITIKETEDLQLAPMKAFPIVEALFGPLRAPGLVRIELGQSPLSNVSSSFDCLFMGIHTFQKRRLFKALGSSFLRPAAEQLYSHVCVEPCQKCNLAFVSAIP